MTTRSLLAVLALVVLAGMLVGCQHQWTYTVKEGDTSYADVAKKVYGNAGYADDIAKANPNVETLSPGQKLKIPEVHKDGQKIRPAGCDRAAIY